MNIHRRAMTGFLLCLMAVATLASPAQAKLLKAIWGPSELSPEGGGLACPARETTCSAFPTYRTLGVDVFQFDIQWQEVAPTRPAHPRDPNDPAYNWGPTAEIVSQAKANGIEPAALVQRAPRWANGGHPEIWAPHNPKLYADFVYAASKRFPSIHRWMIWGEPSRSANFRPMKPGQPGGPRLYARLVNAAYGALKQASPKNIVIGGMTLNGGTIKPPPVHQVDETAEWQAAADRSVGTQPL